MEGEEKYLITLETVPWLGEEDWGGCCDGDLMIRGGVLLTQTLMLNRHSICAPCFQDPSGQVRLCDWLCSMPCYDFSILSSPIEARVEIKLPQE